MAVHSTGIDATTAFLSISAIFVLLMAIPGLALFYGSLVHRKHLVDTMMQSVVVAVTIPILWWLVAYTLCFGNSENIFYGGLEKVFLRSVVLSEVNGVPESAWCTFQLTFAIITPAVMIGAVAERATFWPLILFANLWCLLVYCPVCHMVWGGGLLMKWGVADLAGGLVVETCSGVGAAVLCCVVGPRRCPPEGPDSVRTVLHIVGAALLWVGWLAFNAGSAFANGGQAAVALLNTLLAGASGAASWYGSARLRNARRATTISTAAFDHMGGALAGLVAATPSSGFVEPWASVFLGSVSGCVCYFTDSQLMTRLLRPHGLDDVVAVIAVHGVGGIWGTLATGIFAVEDIGGVRGGVEGNWQQLGVQALSILVVVVWTALGTLTCALAVNLTSKLRATPAEEERGMDCRLHAALWNHGTGLGDPEIPSRRRVRREPTRFALPSPSGQRQAEAAQQSSLQQPLHFALDDGETVSDESDSRKSRSASFENWDAMEGPATSSAADSTGRLDDSTGNSLCETPQSAAVPMGHVFGVGALAIPAIQNKARRDSEMSESQLMDDTPSTATPAGQSQPADRSP